MARPEGHLLPSTSCEPNWLLLSAGGIHDVPQWGQKAALEIRWAHPSVLTSMALDCKPNHKVYIGQGRRQDSTFLE